MSSSPGRISRSQERVRWADVDLVGIMRFSAFTRLVEQAEQEMLREAGMPFSTLFDSPDVWLPRRNLNVDYFAPARIDELLDVECYVSRIGDTSMVYQVDIWNSEGRLVAAASMVIVCVNAGDFRKRSLPAEFVNRLAPFHQSVEQARSARSTSP